MVQSLESNNSLTLERDTAWFQLVPVKICVGAVEQVQELEATERGTRGFGSSGANAFSVTSQKTKVTPVATEQDVGMQEEQAKVAEGDSQQLG